jgi:hypothetical protein
MVIVFLAPSTTLGIGIVLLLQKRANAPRRNDLQVLNVFERRGPADVIFVDVGIN